jgi:hypothetical protein
VEADISLCVSPYHSTNAHNIPIWTARIENHFHLSKKKYRILDSSIESVTVMTAYTVCIPTLGPKGVGREPQDIALFETGSGNNRWELMLHRSADWANNAVKEVPMATMGPSVKSARVTREIQDG